MVMLMRHGVGRVDLIGRVGIRRFDWNGNGREGRCGCGGYAARSGHGATLTVTVHPEDGMGRDGFVHGTSVIDGIGHHGVGLFTVGGRHIPSCVSNSTVLRKIN